MVTLYAQQEVAYLSKTGVCAGQMKCLDLWHTPMAQQ